MGGTNKETDQTPHSIFPHVQNVSSTIAETRMANPGQMQKTLEHRELIPLQERLSRSSLWDISGEHTLADKEIRRFYKINKTGGKPLRRLMQNHCR